MSTLLRWQQASLVGATLAALVLTQPGCRVVGGIFKAGLLMGVVVVVLIAALASALVSMLRRAAPRPRGPLP
jgi:hypothetical protein